MPESFGREPDSFSTIFAREQRGEFAGPSAFDDALWLAACKLMPGKEPVSVELARLPEPFQVYFATRLLEWDVSNGGFAQAAMHNPDLFGTAALGFEVLGKPELAAFVRSAGVYAVLEQSRIEDARRAGVENAFEQFRAYIFEGFDDRLGVMGWYENDADRLAYVRGNRAIFERLDGAFSG